jgi:hypothetical protein
MAASTVLNTEVEEASRPAKGNYVKIDKDTAGVPGSPDIAATIFDKIAKADLFVADVSIIGGTKRRRTPNPNVLVEVGYAVHALGWERVILVFNEAFGTIEELPFDLRPKRIATYNVPDVDGEKAANRRDLARVLEEAIALALQNAPNRTPSPETPEARVARMRREAQDDRTREDTLKREGQRLGSDAAWAFIKLVTEKGNSLLSDYQFRVTVPPQHQPYVAFQVSAFTLIIEWSFRGTRVQRCRLEDAHLGIQVAEIGGNRRVVNAEYRLTLTRGTHAPHWWPTRSRAEDTLSNDDLVKKVMDELLDRIEKWQNRAPEGPRRVGPRAPWIRRQSNYLRRD